MMNIKLLFVSENRLGKSSCIFLAVIRHHMNAQYWYLRNVMTIQNRDTSLRDLKLDNIHKEEAAIDLL